MAEIREAELVRLVAGKSIDDADWITFKDQSQNDRADAPDVPRAVSPPPSPRRPESGLPGACPELLLDAVHAEATENT